MRTRKSNLLQPIVAEAHLSKRGIMRYMLWGLLALMGLLLLGQIGLILASWRRPASQLLHSTPGDRGASPVSISRLQGCPASPNCVCSYDADAEHKIAPFEISGDLQAAFRNIKLVCVEQLKMRVVEESDEYLWIEATSPVMRYVDDVEFLLDKSARVVHVRSASRVGRSDLGANRRRVEEIRQRFSVTSSE